MSLMGSKAKFKVQLTKPMRYTWVEKIPWRRAWLPTPVFLPGEPHRQRSLVGYSPWGRKESDMTDVDLACIHVYIRKYSPFSKEIILDESSQ